VTETTVPALREALKDRNPLVRLVAAESLWKIDPEDRRAVAALAAGLKERAWHLAAEMLGRVGKDAKMALPALVGALKDREMVVRLAAARALLRIDPKAAAKAGVE
jgi:HEAT repeat protein